MGCHDAARDSVVVSWGRFRVGAGDRARVGARAGDRIRVGAGIGFGWGLVIGLG